MLRFGEKDAINLFFHKKSENQPFPKQLRDIIKCPECGSNKWYKDGTRETNGEKKQRYLCRICNYRYTFPSVLNSINDKIDKCQISAKGAKNLDPQQKHTFCVGDIKKVDADTKGLLTQFFAYLEKEAYSAESDYVDKVKHLAVIGAKLLDSEQTKKIIGQMKREDGTPIKNGTKMLYCYAYDAFLKMLRISWEMPSYKQEDHDPFVPDETELDALISASKTKILAAFLQTLKETFADPGEALRIKWLDVDTNRKTISIRYPVKNHLPRTLNVSNRLLSMIDDLPKKAERVFPCTYNAMLRRFVVTRKRTAEIHKNPRLLAVDFTAYRTWAGTMIAYHTNGNVLTVKKLLGHKQIKNTMKYIGRIEFKDTDFETTSATTVEDILRLGKEGWIKYDVVTISNVEYHCYRRPKRFNSYA